MSLARIVGWVVSVCPGLRLSQRKTLGELVVGAIRCRRVSLADIGRSMRTGAYGWGLRQSRVSSSDWLHRLLLVLAFAYLWLLMLKTVCREEMSEAHWASGTSTRRRQTSAFVVGRIMLDQVRFPLRLLLRRLADLLSQLAEENRG